MGNLSSSGGGGSEFSDWSDPVSAPFIGADVGGGGGCVGWGWGGCWSISGGGGGREDSLTCCGSGCELTGRKISYLVSTFQP